MDRSESPSRAVILALSVVLLAAAVAPAAVTSATDAPDVTVATADDELTLNAGPGQVVAGNTTLPPGTELSVRVRSTGGPPFLQTVLTTVDDRGRYRAVFDLTEVPVDTPVTVVVHRSGDPLTTVEGAVGPCTAACNATRPADPAAATSLALDDGRLTLGAAAGRAVRGETSLPPGTTLAVRVRSTGGDSPFILSRNAVVGDDGRFRAVYNLSEMDPGTPISVTVVANDTRVATADGQVVTCLQRCGPRAATPTATPAPLPGVNGTTVAPTTASQVPLPPRLTGMVTLAVGGLLGVLGVAVLLGLVRP
jgi:hypothetical protein